MISEEINVWLLRYRAAIRASSICSDQKSRIEFEEELMRLEIEWKSFLERIEELELDL